MTLTDILTTFHDGDEILLEEENPYVDNSHMSKDLPPQYIIQLFLSGAAPECHIISARCGDDN